MTINPSILEQIGLNQKQANVYLALLEIGNARASQIAEKSKLLRPHVYNILTSLKQEGLVNSDEINGVSYFSACSPQKLVNQVRKKEQSLLNVMPQLESIYNLNPIKPVIRFYEGTTDIKKILQEPLEILNRGDQFYRINPDQAKMAEIIGLKWWQNLARQRILKGISVKVIADKSDLTAPELISTDPKQKRQVRFLPDDLHIPVRLQIYHDRVAIFDLEKMTALVIENRNITKLHQIFFDSLWEKCNE